MELHFVAGLVVCAAYWLAFDVACIIARAHTRARCICMLNYDESGPVAVIKLLALRGGCFKAQTPLAITQVICQPLVINVSLIERAGNGEGRRY